MKTLFFSSEMLIKICLEFYTFDAFQLQISPSFTPTSVIRKMYATKEKSKDEQSSRSETKEEATTNSQEGTQ